MLNVEFLMFFYAIEHSTLNILVKPLFPLFIYQTYILALDSH